MTLIQLIWAYCDNIKNNRSKMGIFAAASSEMGELAIELAIDAGESYKKAGPDGITGESIDAIICLVDLIRKENPGLTELGLMEIALSKLEKWACNEDAHKLLKSQ